MRERTLTKSKPGRSSERPRNPEPGARNGLAAPTIVREVLRSSGQPLDPKTRSWMEPRLRHDFSRVRVHDGLRAAESARRLQAHAYTVGRDVVFGTNQFSPNTPRGRRLLAHELTHVVQQRDAPDAGAVPDILIGPVDDAFERDARRQSAAPESSPPAVVTSPALTKPTLQRSSIGSFFSDFFSGSVGPIDAIARAFGSEDYSEQELKAYLAKITKDKTIEDRYDSDNKARAIVKKWNQKKPGFDLTPPIRILLIREMQSGYTSGADEQAILTILRNSTFPELKEIFGPSGIDPQNLDSDFGGAAAIELHAFYDQHFEGGTKAVLSGQKALTLHVQKPYKWAEFKAIVDQRIKRIETAVRGAPEDQRDEVSSSSAQASAGEVYAELQKLTAAEQEQAIQDMSGERAREDTLLSDVTFKKNDPSDKKDAKTLADLTVREQVLTAALQMLDLILQGSSKDVAIGAPKGKKEFGKTTTALTAAQAKAATEALKPLTREQVVSEVSGKPAPPAAKFVQKLPGEKKSYDDQIRERAPKMIDDYYNSIAAPRGEKEHADVGGTHQLSELEAIAEASRDETDRVFGNFKKAPAFKADKFTAAGKLSKKGNIHDAWLSEQAKFKADPSYQGQSADFWMFYLLENDNNSQNQQTIKQIEYKHNASPLLDDKHKALNDEAKVIAEVGNKYAKSDSKRLFEIGRGWDAFNTSGEVSVQLFKNPDPKRDRAFLWDMFFTLIHEYLHSLAESKYNTYAEHLGGEASPQGNTLIEGVDSLLTETVWTHAKPRASLPQVRKAVEPDAVKAGEAFDASLLPDPANRRYDSYPNAVKLVSVVGIRNLYAAYFYGDVKLIGGK